MGQIGNKLVVDALRVIGLKNIDEAQIMPVATGMSVLLCLLTIRAVNKSALVNLSEPISSSSVVLPPFSTTNNKNIVVWFRADQASVPKAIEATGFEILVLDGELNDVARKKGREPIDDGELNSITYGIRPSQKVFRDLLKSDPSFVDKIAAVVSCAACFAPRASDSLVSIAELCEEYKIPHIINASFGGQSASVCLSISQASLVGRVDFVVMSLDKNFGVPVGGGLVLGMKTKKVRTKQKISGAEGTVTSNQTKEAPIPKLNISVSDLRKIYPGRCSVAAVIELVTTLLGLGKKGIAELYIGRARLYEYACGKAYDISAKYSLKMVSKCNDISIALVGPGVFDIETFKEIGPRLFKRRVTGQRVTSGEAVKTFGGTRLTHYGAHSNIVAKEFTPFLTFAVGVGVTKREIDEFFDILNSEFTRLKR